MEYIKIRKAVAEDAPAIFTLYQEVSKIPGGLARNADEITQGYVQSFCTEARKRGIQLLAEAEQKIIAEIHCFSNEPKAFSHVLSNLTMAVHPQHQGKGIGFQLFSQLLGVVKNELPHVERIELIVRESNLKAIALYEKLGFCKEGRMEKRIKSATGLFEADILMAWLR